VVFENDRVRVLDYRDYRDSPGDRTSLHSHPDMVIIPLSSFSRRLTVDGRTVEVEKTAHEARWVPARRTSGRTWARRRRTRSSSS
jgi:hypothetical protein